MSTHEKETFYQTYNWADDRHQLPWAHEEQSLFLADICHVKPGGKALDIGCGGGTDSIFLASQGWNVTALDFMPKALDFTRERAEAQGLDVRLVEADIVEWEPDDKYDLVLDHGLLHNMDPIRHSAYRNVLLEAMAADGHFVLLHWHPLFPGQPSGELGPTRRSREEIDEFFAPELIERFFAREEFEDLPDAVGGGMTQAYYWFQRNPILGNEALVIEQVKGTCAQHDVDTSTDGSGADAELLTRLVGPGRLGMSVARIETSALDGVLEDFAARAGTGAGELRQLLSAFADEEGGLCHTNPRCTDCGVRLCKRLRER